MAAEAVAAPTDVHWFVVRRPQAWTYAPVPAQDPSPIDVEDVLARMATGSGEHQLRTGGAMGRALPAIGPRTALEPVWMFVGLVAGGNLIVGAPDGDEILLDELDVRLLDALVDGATPELLAQATGLESADAVAGRLARLVAVGCVAIRNEQDRHDAAAAPHDVAADQVEPDAEAPEPEAPSPEPVPDAPAPSPPAAGPSLRVRLGDAYRLSSKLRPVRDAVDRLRGRRPD